MRQGREAALCAASRFSFFKVEMPWRIKRVSFCALRLLPGEQFFFLPSFFFLGLRLLPGAGHGVRGAAAPPLDRMWRCPRTAEKARFFLVLGRGRLLPQPSECFLLKRKHSPPCTPYSPLGGNSKVVS